MASRYRYSLSGGIVIEVIDNWGPLNEWKEVGVVWEALRY